MESIRLLFTKRAYNPVSWAIRAALPVSITTWGHSSHCIVVDGDNAIEATMLHRVRRVPLAEALRGAAIVATVDYQVVDAEAGLVWCRQQVGKPYDFKGAFGVGLKPDRNWQKDDAWFCYELGAATLVQAGLDIFADCGHINGNILLSLRPNLQLSRPALSIA